MPKFHKILALDTSTEACSVAVSVNGTILEAYEHIPKAHTRHLLPMIDRLLKEASLEAKELDALSFGRGPGSFTGVRIACSVIQGLGLGLNKPIVPVSTLRSIAQGAYRNFGFTRVFASLDARMQEIYWGLFELGPQNIMYPISEEKVGPASAVVLPPGHFEAVSEYPHARDIVEIALVEYELGHTQDASQVLPVYIRDEVVKKA